MTAQAMTSNRPYLIRALYDWLVDNGLTPYLLVDARRDQVQVPTRFVEDGRIVLNVSTTAVRNLILGNDWIMFEARFGGAPHQISLPPDAVLGVYARENGKGMLFPDEPADQPEQQPDPDGEPASSTGAAASGGSQPKTSRGSKKVGKKKPTLKVIK